MAATPVRPARWLRLALLLPKRGHMLNAELCRVVELAASAPIFFPICIADRPYQSGSVFLYWPEVQVKVRLNRADYGAR
jgi:hypothetical protein